MLRGAGYKTKDVGGRGLHMLMRAGLWDGEREWAWPVYANDGRGHGTENASGRGLRMLMRGGAMGS